MTEVIEKTKINLCTTCMNEFATCDTKAEDVKFGDGVGKDNVIECACYKVCTQEELEKRIIKRLFQIKEQTELLNNEKKELEDSLPESVVYQNEDGTWTRFIKVDNLKELEEKGSIFRASITNRYTTKLETLKNQPK